MGVIAGVWSPIETRSVKELLLDVGHVGVTPHSWILVMFRLAGLFRLARRSVCSAADDMAKGKFFYAVKKGFKPGVYGSW